ncbi:MAG: FAD-binding oxidoreductase [Halioglobus sp.]
MVKLDSWGRLGSQQHRVRALHDATDLTNILGAEQGLARGMGRSYGDVCLNPDGTVWDCLGLDKFIEFDPERGLLRCEAGVLIRDIQLLVVSRGWMLPVTPGTWFVTVGGAIANDVHGKNHHSFGTFGDHVQSLLLQRTDGQRISCSRDSNLEWLSATVGGLGLTGLIVEAELQLRPVTGPLLDVDTQAFSGLRQFYQMSEDAKDSWEYAVAWIDCVHPGSRRGIFMRANHRDVSADNCDSGIPRQLSLSVTPPVSLVNALTLKPFNSAYYRLHKWRAGKSVSHYQPYFYPLDKVGEWNRMYGPKGFYQYQCLIPGADTEAVVEELLAVISAANCGSFLAVLKTFAARPAAGLLSFPSEGTTLALDFPNQGRKTHDLFDQLDSIVGSVGGRLYPAKDARMPRSLFESGYPRLEEFLAYRDPGISSGLSRRLLGN